MAKERPLSPHLQAYKLPFTAILSTAHRISGFLLSTLGFILLIYWIAGVAGGPEQLAKHVKVLGNPFVVLVLFLMTFSLFYHLCNGIRHLFWDIGKGYALEQANKSGKAVVIVSIIMTVLFWIVISSV